MSVLNAEIFPIPSCLVPFDTVVIPVTYPYSVIIHCLVTSFAFKETLIIYIILIKNKNKENNMLFIFNSSITLFMWI